METVQLTLKKEVYKDPTRLQEAIATIRAQAKFESLDTKYAERLGVLSGRLPGDSVDTLREFDCVSSVQVNEVVSKRSPRLKLPVHVSGDEHDDAA